MNSTLCFGFPWPGIAPVPSQHPGLQRGNGVRDLSFQGASQRALQRGGKAKIDVGAEGSASAPSSADPGAASMEDFLGMRPLRAKSCSSSRPFGEQEGFSPGWGWLESFNSTTGGKCSLVPAEGSSGQLVPHAGRGSFHEQSWQECHFTSVS